jgi:hypothetical protein
MGLQTTTADSTAMATRVNAESVTVLIKFVRALAKRQARIDAGLHPSNEPRTLH